MSSNYPPGTSASDPRAPWNRDEIEVPCRCGHAESDHDGEEGPICTVDGCDCDCYEERELEPEDFEPDEPDYDSRPGGADEY